MAIQRIDQAHFLGIDDSNNKLHYVRLNGDATETDLGAINFGETGGTVDVTSDSLTFSRVVITQAGAGYHSLKVGASGSVVRLHGITLTSSVAGTITFQSSDDITGADSGGGTLAALSGAMNIAANGGFVIPFNSDPRACLQTTDLSIGFTTTDAIVKGFAVVSIS